MTEEEGLGALSLSRARWLWFAGSRRVAFFVDLGPKSPLRDVGWDKRRSGCNFDGIYGFYEVARLVFGFSATPVSSVKCDRGANYKRSSIFLPESGGFKAQRYILCCTDLCVWPLFRRLFGEACKRRVPCGILGKLLSGEF